MAKFAVFFSLVIGWVFILPLLYARPFPSCGTFEVRGRLKCVGIEDCLILISPGTKSETLLRVENFLPGLRLVNEKEVWLKIRVREIRTQAVEALEENPRLSLLERDRPPVKLLEASPCENK